MSATGRAASMARHAPHYRSELLEQDEWASWRVATLLEDGDRRELRALVEDVGAKRLRQWLVERGARQLSRRSLAFWALVLDAKVTATSGRDELWPL